MHDKDMLQKYLAKWKIRYDERRGYTRALSEDRRKKAELEQKEKWAGDILSTVFGTMGESVPPNLSPYTEPLRELDSRIKFNAQYQNLGQLTSIYEMLNYGQSVSIKERLVVSTLLNEKRAYGKGDPQLSGATKIVASFYVVLCARLIYPKSEDYRTNLEQMQMAWNVLLSGGKGSVDNLLYNENLEAVIAQAYYTAFERCVKESEKAHRKEEAKELYLKAYVLFKNIYTSGGDILWVDFEENADRSFEDAWHLCNAMRSVDSLWSSDTFKQETLQVGLQALCNADLQTTGYKIRQHRQHLLFRVYQAALQGMVDLGEHKGRLIAFGNAAGWGGKKGDGVKEYAKYYDEYQARLRELEKRKEEEERKRQEEAAAEERRRQEEAAEAERKCQQMLAEAEKKRRKQEEERIRREEEAEKARVKKELDDRTREFQRWAHAYIAKDMTFYQWLPKQYRKIADADMEHARFRYAMGMPVDESGYTKLAQEVCVPGLTKYLDDRMRSHAQSGAQEVSEEYINSLIKNYYDNCWKSLEQKRHDIVVEKAEATYEKQIKQYVAGMLTSVPHIFKGLEVSAPYIANRVTDMLLKEETVFSQSIMRHYIMQAAIQEESLEGITQEHVKKYIKPNYDKALDSLEKELRQEAKRKAEEEKKQKAQALAQAAEARAAENAKKKEEKAKKAEADKRKKENGIRLQAKDYKIPFWSSYIEVWLIVTGGFGICSALLEKENAVAVWNIVFATTAACGIVVGVVVFLEAKLLLRKRSKKLGSSYYKAYSILNWLINGVLMVLLLVGGNSLQLLLLKLILAAAIYVGGLLGLLLANAF